MSRSEESKARHREYNHRYQSGPIKGQYLAQKARYRAEHAEQIKASWAAYYTTNRENILARQKAYRDRLSATPQCKARKLLRELRALTSKARKKTAARRWKQGNKERQARYWARYYAANRERIQALDRVRNKAYRLANPEKNRARRKKYRKSKAIPAEYREKLAAAIGNIRRIQSSLMGTSSNEP